MAKSCGFEKSETRVLKSAVGIRGDCLYCPLPLSIDSYWNCMTDCHHCYFRKLNRTWGQDLRPADPDMVAKKLQNGLKNKSPRSSLAWALSKRKTLRLGNKTDPYQDVERDYRISRRIQQTLIDLKWTYVIQTRFLGNLIEDEGLVDEAHSKNLITIMPIISPGVESDWEVLERGRTTPIPKRFRIMKRWTERGYNLGVNGEPFIPGYHTPEDFRGVLRRLKEIGVESYNTYNLHFNDHVAKRLHSIGIDIERIWYYNQDKKWKHVQRTLCQIAKDEGMRLGCPDFVNTGKDWKEEANTCCGINVPSPSLFNTHHFKRLSQEGNSPKKILSETWEGIGDRATGEKIVEGGPCDFYTLGDVK